MLDIPRITIIGTGLLGGSIGLALRAKGYTGRRIGLGRRRETLARAQELGCVDEISDNPARALAATNFIVLATPIAAFPQWLSLIAPHAPADAIITDVGSTKGWVCAQVQMLLPEPLRGRFVGAHPMAGAERTGPDAARADLFAGKSCILTPENHTDPHAAQIVESFWAALGMRTLRMSPAAHDDAVARISHLPHALAVLLVKLASDQGGIEIASTGFRDTTRVASSNAELWADIFLTNRAAVLAALEMLCGEAQAFKNILGKQDRAALIALLNQTRAQRDAWMSRQSWTPEG